MKSGRKNTVSWSQCVIIFSKVSKKDEECHRVACEPVRSIVRREPPGQLKGEPMRRMFSPSGDTGVASERWPGQLQQLRHTTCFPGHWVCTVSSPRPATHGRCRLLGFGRSNRRWDSYQKTGLPVSFGSLRKSPSTGALDSFPRLRRREEPARPLARRSSGERSRGGRADGLEIANLSAP